MRSFVFGNGSSRSAISPHLFYPYGALYGCNAIYRTFNLDYLIAVDPCMIDEINQSAYQHTHEVWTNYNEKYANYNRFNYFNPSLGWSSGPTALHLATTHSPDEIFIFGFDYVGVNGLFNNVYADTINYKKSTDVATYYNNWEWQTEQIIKHNTKIKFNRVVNDIYYDPEWDYQNFCNINYKEVLDIKKTWNKTR